MRILIGLLSFFAPFTAHAMGDHKPNGPFEVHGHRGARALEPENSMHAFHLAMDNRVHVIEADMVMTKDHHIVLNHDLSINTELCSSDDSQLQKLKTPRVDSLTLEQVQTYDCGAKIDPEFPSRKIRPGSKIPTLRELLTLAKEHQEYQPELTLNLETKIAPHASPESVETFIQLLLNDLRELRFSPKHVIIQSFDFRSLRKMRASASRIKISALVGEGFDFDKVTQGLRPDYLSPHASHISKAQVRKAHKLGIKVVPWTLNKRSHWSHFIGMGVDGIITDDPIALMEYLED